MMADPLSREREDDQQISRKSGNRESLMRSTASPQILDIKRQVGNREYDGGNARRFIPEHEAEAKNAGQQSKRVTDDQGGNRGAQRLSHLPQLPSHRCNQHS